MSSAVIEESNVPTPSSPTDSEPIRTYRQICPQHLELVLRRWAVARGLTETMLMSAHRLNPSPTFRNQFATLTMPIIGDPSGKGTQPTFRLAERRDLNASLHEVFGRNNWIDGRAAKSTEVYFIGPHVR